MDSHVNSLKELHSFISHKIKLEEAEGIVPTSSVKQYDKALINRVPVWELEENKASGRGLKKKKRFFFMFCPFYGSERV